MRLLLVTAAIALATVAYFTASEAQTSELQKQTTTFELQNKTLAVTWTSPFERYYGAASCHPHCQPGEGNTQHFQESYPADMDGAHFFLTCRGNGHSGNPCAFDDDQTVIKTDTTRHVADVTWLNRSDEVWRQLAASK